MLKQTETKGKTMSHEKTGAVLVSTGRMDLNAHTAAGLLNSNEHFVADRPINSKHVARLAAEMQAGHFLPELTSIIMCELNGKKYRLNGQHTATAVLECVKENPDFSISGVSLQTFLAESEDDMRALYARIDRGAPRTNTHVALSLLAGTANFSELSLRVIRMLPPGLAFWLHENQATRLHFGGESATRAVQEDYLQLSLQVGAFMNELNYHSTHHGHMFRAPVIAALYATFVVDYEDALTFWRAVATGIGFTSEAEPAARLRQLLRGAIIAGGHQYRNTKMKIGTEEMYRACLHAWNRYREHGIFIQALRPTVLKSRPEVK